MSTKQAAVAVPAPSENGAKRTRPQRLLRDTRGLSSVEYALLFVLLCVGSLAVWQGLSRDLHCQIERATASFSRALGGTPTESATAECTAQRSSAGPASALPAPSGHGPGQSSGTRPGSGSGSTNHGKPPPGAPPSGKPSTITTGLGNAIDTVVATQCPGLANDVRALTSSGWEIRYSKPGEPGSFTKHRAQVIVIDSSKKAQTETTTQLLAHEVGHAKRAVPAEVPMTGLTRQQYVDRNVAPPLASEGSATLRNEEARAEFLKNGGKDIGVAGTQGKKYDRIYQQYKAGKLTRAQAETKIGQVYGVGETTSTNGQNYRAYYAKQYEAKWDVLYAGKPKGFVAP